MRQLLDLVAEGKDAMSALENMDRIRLWDARKQGLPATLSKPTNSKKVAWSARVAATSL